MTKNIIIKTSVQKRFDSFMAHGRVLFFSAPCGFGKTVLADALLRGRNVLRQSAADPDCAIPPSAQDWDILLIDDLQFMQEEAGQQALSCRRAAFGGGPSRSAARPRRSRNGTATGLYPAGKEQLCPKSFVLKT